MEIKRGQAIFSSLLEGIIMIRERKNAKREIKQIIIDSERLFLEYFEQNLVDMKPYGFFRVTIPVWTDFDRNSYQIIEKFRKAIKIWYFSIKILLLKQKREPNSEVERFVREDLVSRRNCPFFTIFWHFLIGNWTFYERRYENKIYKAPLIVRNDKVTKEERFHPRDRRSKRIALDFHFSFEKSTFTLFLTNAQFLSRWKSNNHQILIKWNRSPNE